jgi:uncharacterized protein with von Willebrand factor type A (vWA) domain
MFTPDEIDKAKTALPKIVADFVDSSSVRSAIAEIGKRESLNLHEVDALTQLVNATIADLVPRTAFRGGLSEALPRLSQERREKILNDVNEVVFKVIQARLHQPSTKSPE